MRRALWSLVALTIFLVCLLPTTAQAADELGLSWDGRTWSQQLSEPMFDAKTRWVPGDVGTKAFHVRNQSESGANLTISVVTRDIDGLLRYEDIRLSARVGAGEWVNLESTEENFRLNNAALPAGESREVEVEAQFDFASPNRSQRKQLMLMFRVTLSDANASPEDSVGPGPVKESTAPGGPDVNDNPRGTLANAGAPAVGWVLVAGGVAIGAGLSLIKRRKREETGHEPSH